MSAPGTAAAPPFVRHRRRVRLRRAEPLVWIAPAFAVVAFVFGEKGLIADVSLEGAKVTKLPQ